MMNLKINYMCYDSYYFAGMHLLWWCVWIFFLFWVFAMPYYIPGERRPKESPKDILKRRLASGEITNEEFKEKKNILEND